MANGVATTNLDKSSTITELIANGEQGTVLISYAGLATLLANSGAVSEKLAINVVSVEGLTDRMTSVESELVTNTIYAATWPGDLENITPTTIGQGAEIVDEASGTHIDPVSGLSVPNAGRYRAFGLGAGEFERISGTGLSSKADQSDMTTALNTLPEKVDKADGFKFGGAQLPSLNDGNGVELLGFDDNGRAILRLSQRSFDDLVASLGPKLLQSADIDFPAFVDADGVEILGFDGDGRARFAVSQNVANQVAAMLDFSELIQPEEVSRDIVVFGHSVAAAGSGIGPTLAALFPDRNVYTEGIGGQDGLQVFQRQGALPVTGVFVSNEIPATGEVAVSDIVLLNGSGTRSIKVEVETSGGDWIHGTLAFKTGSVYGFTRTVGGSVESVPNPATVRVLTGLSGVELSEFDKMIQVWLPFRNDVADGVGDPIDGAFNPQTQMTYLAAAMERVSTNRVVILGDINGAADGTSGTKLRGVERSNKAVKAVYPENFIDVIELCDGYGLTEITTADDGRDYIKITSDFSSDGLHPSDEVGKPVMAQAAKDHIISKGW